MDPSNILNGADRLRHHKPFNSERCEDERSIEVAGTNFQGHLRHIQVQPYMNLRL
jgi:hypothetical protein